MEKARSFSEDDCIKICKDAARDYLTVLLGYVQKLREHPVTKGMSTPEEGWDKALECVDRSIRHNFLPPENNET